MSESCIVIIDDDVAFGGLIKRVLTAMGHAVVQLSDPHELMQRYDDVTPDVIFLDIFMPGMDGMAVARWLSQKSFAGKLVFMTGHDRTFLAAACAAMRGSDAEVLTLEKPARIERIRELLQVRGGKSQKQLFSHPRVGPHN